MTSVKAASLLLTCMSTKAMEAIMLAAVIPVFVHFFNNLLMSVNVVS